MPLFTHHPSLSWPSLTPSSFSRGASRASSSSTAAATATSPARGAGPVTATAKNPTIDDDPFAYFITPPAFLSAADEDDVYPDWTAGILSDSRKRARSLSSLRFVTNISDISTDDGAAADVHLGLGLGGGLDAPPVAVAGSPNKMARPAPMLWRTLRGWMRVGRPRVPRPRAPRLQPTTLAVDDVPELSPLSTPLSTPPSSPPPPPSTSAVLDSPPRGSASASASSDAGPAAPPALARAHSPRPRSWRSPDSQLFTVPEDTAVGIEAAEAAADADDDDNNDHERQHQHEPQEIDWDSTLQSQVMQLAMLLERQEEERLEAEAAAAEVDTAVRGPAGEEKKDKSRARKRGLRFGRRWVKRVKLW